MGGGVPIAEAEPVATQIIEVTAPSTLDAGESKFLMMIFHVGTRWNSQSDSEDRLTFFSGFTSRLHLFG